MAGYFTFSIQDRGIAIRTVKNPRQVGNTAEDRGGNVPKQTGRDGVYYRKYRRKPWAMSYVDGYGRRIRKGGFATREAAELARSAALLRAEQTRILGFVPPGDDTIAELISRFLEYKRPRLTIAGFERL